MTELEKIAYAKSFTVYRCLEGREITYDWYSQSIPMDQGYYRISQFGLISNIFIIK